MSGRNPKPPRALDYAGAEQTLREGRNQVERHILAASRHAEQRYPAWVSPKRGYVLLHPPKRGNLVEKTIIAGDLLRALRIQGRMRQESEHVQSELNRH